MRYVVPILERPSLRIQGEKIHFPVHRIYCVGRNYAAHAKEMGGDPNREPPFFFSKPADAIVPNGPVPYPPATKDLHHEVELVVALAKGGRDIPADEALHAVFGYAVGIDLTRRDLQETAKKSGRPWDMAKGFDFSAPCGVIRRADSHPKEGTITLAVNGEVRQKGNLSDMIWPVADVIAHLSRLVTLMPGDLIFTGTPEGVGAVKKGDKLSAAIERVGTLDIQLV